MCRHQISQAWEATSKILAPRYFNVFQPGLAFQIETSPMICIEN